MLDEAASKLIMGGEKIEREHQKFVVVEIQGPLLAAVAVWLVRDFTTSAV